MSDLQDTLLSDAMSPPSVNDESPQFDSKRHRATRGRGSSGAGGLFGYNSLKNKTQATTVWYDELQPPPTRGGEYDEFHRDADDAADNKKIRYLESAFTPHVFTRDERTRMDNFEAIDYAEPVNLLHAEFLVSDARRQQKRYLKWVIFVAIGVCVGLWAVLLFQSIDWISERKLDMLEYFMGLGWNPPSDPRLDPGAASSMSASGFGSSSGNYSGNSSHGDMNRPIYNNGLGGEDLAPGNAIVQGYFGYITWSCFAAVISSLLCVIMPSAAGSGIPDVMAYLNGIMFPRVFNIRTLFVKTLSCILAISSGLPVGAEGPIIHIGALIGAALPTGRSRTFGQKNSSSKTSFLAAFRNSKDQRDFISGGAAAGVTGAFGSPIGGMLFVMEEIATYFPAKLAWMVFFSCLATITVMHMLNSFFSGWELRDRSSIGFGNFVDSATVLFETQGGPSVVPMNLFTLLPSCIAGVVFGAMAIGFTLLNIKVARFRGRVINRSSLRRVMEPLCVIFFFGTLSYFLPLLFNCVDIPPALKVEELQHIRLVSSFCKYPETQFNPMATLTLTSSYNVIRLLYTRRTAGLIPWEALVLYQIQYTLGASYSGGMFLSSGMVIPTLFVGAIGGRLIGQLIGQSWSDPGVIALVGSAAFFGGISRLTFSLIVIMLEISNDLTHIICLMVAVIVARTIANKACHSLYHLQLEVKCAPFLDDATQQLHKLDTHTAADIISNNSSEVVSLRSTERIITILEVLSMTKHNAFPVVSLKKKQPTRGGGTSPSTGSSPTKQPQAEAPDAMREGLGAGRGGKFKGLILRQQLEELLWYLKLRPSGTKSVAHARREDILAIRDYQFWNRCENTFPEDLSPDITALSIDLNPYLDPSAYFVRENMCVSRTFDIFRNLGLRHLVVLNRNHCVAGIITRKNLIGDRLNDALKAADAHQISGTWKASERPSADDEGAKTPPPPPDASADNKVEEKKPLSGEKLPGYGSNSE